MVGDDQPDRRIGRRSYLYGSAAAVGALSTGSVAGVTDDEHDEHGDRRPTEIDSCTTITSPGFYVLTSDLEVDPGETCIEIRASHVVLDGRGHTISGGRNATGVSVAPAKKGRLSDVTVANLSLEAMTTGIHCRRLTDGLITTVETSTPPGAPGSPGVTLTNVSSSIVQGNTLIGVFGTGLEITESNEIVVSRNMIGAYQTGLRVVDGKELQIFGNEIEGTAILGASLHQTSDSDFSGNDVQSDDHGIDLGNIDGIRFAGNSISASSLGLFVVETRNSEFTGNTVDSGLDGITLVGSNENDLLGNGSTAIGSGIALSESHGNRLRGNTANGNDNSGIVLEESNRNTISRNVAMQNGEYGFSLLDSSGNRGRGNRAAGNAAGPIAIVGGRNNSIEVNGVVYTGTTPADVTPEDITPIAEESAALADELEATTNEDG